MSNANSVALTRWVYACEYKTVNFCESFTDFWVDLDQEDYSANELKVETITFKRFPAQGIVEVTFNGNTDTKANLPYTTTGGDLYLNFDFRENYRIRFHLMLIYNGN
jgi:hypothetical protein